MAFPGLEGVQRRRRELIDELVRARKQSGLSQTDVAARMGTSQSAVARLESGRIVVVEDTCPHDGGRISDGFVAGERLVCSRHGWELEPCGRVCTRVR